MSPKQDDVMSLCKRRGFVWPSFELYGGVAGLYDYGPLGFSLRNNIVDIWRNVYKGGEGFIEIDTETVSPAEVFKASGHVEKFADKITYCEKCKAPWRADHLVGDLYENPDTMSEEELDRAFVEHGIKCPECGGDLGKVEDFNLMFKTNIGPGSVRTGYLRPETAQGIFVNFLNLYRYNRNKLPLGVLQTGRGYRNEIAPRQGMVRQREFNMMEVELFIDPADKTWPRYDSLKHESLTLIPNTTLEPVVMTVEEAVDKHIIDNEALAYFVCITKKLLVRLGIDEERLRFREHEKDEMAHYAKDCWDAEALLSYGWTEITGIADRGNWDLSRHAQFSGADLTHFQNFEETVERDVQKVKPVASKIGPTFKARAKEISAAIEASGPGDISKDGTLTVRIGDGETVEIPEDMYTVATVKEKVTGERIVPNVIEPSYGLDRVFYSVLEHAYTCDDEGYAVLRLKPEVAPIKVGVFPLMEKDGMDDFARDLCSKIHTHRAEAYYDGSGTIGKRYARMDEVGTPWCITVDYDTLEGESKGTVTIRDRDTKEQKRIPASDAANIISDMLDGTLSFKDL